MPPNPAPSSAPPGSAPGMVRAEDITVILVTYNSSAILPWSLAPLRSHPEVVVVDNASRDDTLAVVRRLLPQARVIEAGANLGFGRANNLGLAACRTPLALVLNPDCKLGEGALPALAAAADRWPEAALLAPVLYDGPGQLGDSWRGVVPNPPPPPADRRPPDGDQCVAFLTGAVVLLRRAVFDRIGGFDPWFFLYLEDDELCDRVRTAGHNLVLVADAQAEHHTRGSSAPSFRTSWRRHYCMTLSKLYLTRKRRGDAWKAQAWRMGMGSFLALPVQVLGLRTGGMAKHAARLKASVLAARHLRRAHCFEPED